MSFAALTIDLNARLASFEQGLKRAELAATQSAGRMERAFGVASKSIAALGGVLSVGMLAGFARDALASASALDDMAESTGATVEGLSKLVDIARIGGLDVGQVQTALIRLTKALSGLDDESKGAGAAFQALGLNMAELARLSPEQALERVAQAFGRFADGAGKTSAALAIFGRGGAELLPLLNDIASSSERVASLTAEQAAAAERLEKNWNALAVSTSNWARSLVLDLVPALNQFFAIAAKAGMGGALDVVVLRKKLGIGDENIQAEIRKQQEKLDQLIEDREKSLTPLFRPTERDIANQRAYIAGLKELASIEAMAGQSAYGNEGKLPSLPIIPSQAGRAGAARARARANDDTYIADVFQAAAGDLKKFADELERTRSSYIDLIEPQQRFFDRMNDLERIAPLLGLTAEQIERIRDVLRDQAAAAEFGEPLKDVIDAVGPATDLVKDLGMTFESAFEAAIAGGENLRDVLRAIEQDILRIITRKLVTEPLGGFFTDMVKGFDPGKIFLDLLGAKDGGIFPGGFKAFASGGIAASPTLGLVGEGGMNEAIVPLPNGRAIPVEMRGGAGTVIMHIATPDVSGFRASQGQIIADAQRALSRGRRNL